MNPVTANASRYIFQVNILRVVRQQWEFFFAEDLEECTWSQISQLAVGQGWDAKLALDLLGLILLAPEFEQAYLHELFQAEDATSVDMFDEVEDISLLSGLLPVACPRRNDRLGGDSHLGLHLHPATLHEVQRITVALARIVDSLFRAEKLRAIENATHILN